MSRVVLCCDILLTRGWDDVARISLGRLHCSPCISEMRHVRCSRVGATQNADSTWAACVRMFPHNGGAGRPRRTSRLPPRSVSGAESEDVSMNHSARSSGPTGTTLHDRAGVAARRVGADETAWWLAMQVQSGRKVLWADVQRTSIVGISDSLRCPLVLALGFLEAPRQLQTCPKTEALSNGWCDASRGPDDWPVTRRASNGGRTWELGRVVVHE